MELDHQFTVPTGVEETWAHFEDVASVAECFPGAAVTSVEGPTFQGPARSSSAPSRSSTPAPARSPRRTRRRTASWSRPRARTSAATARPARPSPSACPRRTRRHRRVGAHRPGDHRQAGAVRPGCHAGRLGQAARSVRRLPRATARSRRRRGRERGGSVGGGGQFISPHRPPPLPTSPLPTSPLLTAPLLTRRSDTATCRRRHGRRARDTGSSGRARPRPKQDDALDLGATVLPDPVQDVLEAGPGLPCCSWRW